MKALITAAMKPPPMMMPIRGSSQPAMTAPMMPTMIVADQSEAAAPDHHAGKPAGNGADDQPNDDASPSIAFPPFLRPLSNRKLGRFPSVCQQGGATLEQLCTQLVIAVQHKLRQTQGQGVAIR